MKHFIMRCHPDFEHRVHITGWEGRICREWISFEKLYKIPPHSILTVSFKDDLPLPDILMTPFLMVSEMVYKVIKMYGEEVYDRDIVLVDPERDTQNNYHLLLLKNAENEEYLLKNGCMFYLKIKEKTVLVVNQDFAESILRRGAIGIHLEEIIW